MQLNDRSQPEPDIALLKPREDFSESGHPQQGDILLLVEVADTTLEADREIKIPLYTEAQIPEVWIVNLHEQWVEVYSQSEENEYRDVGIFRRGESLSILAFGEESIGIDEVLGK
ncbi:MAG: Uma2 family endonuclease [Geitlerinemataceae cyanobacterium]